jgi:hypothetical protein
MLKATIMPAKLAEHIDEEKNILLREHQLESGSWRRTKTLRLKKTSDRRVDGIKSYINPL